MIIFAIDPGSTQSGVVAWNNQTGQFYLKEKLDNAIVRQVLPVWAADNTGIHFVIEQITLYQRSDSAIHDTIVWYGRFFEVLKSRGVTPVFITRADVKKELLPGNRTTDRKDSTVCAYLKDRFAPGVSNNGKGTKKEPGYFYGFKADIWQAFALAVAYSDQVAADSLEQNAA
jgi:hypothetical protein